ncbi:activating transcription factor 4b [Gouania willdenowi]|uniref:Cyclic AMP-dependent transcription factor ATF-4 n=1 Tax=Gouania willdenowi TaxID=441366 RepID=A0A8C5E009_GOUWI|nr:cyclic AMP-dependent transcription factor ATF-4-like [Gouania willdenowi]
MTMTMTSSQFGLEDMEALLRGPFSPMVDVVDSLFVHPDKEPQSGGGPSAPGSPHASSFLSFSSSPPPFYSPPPSPLAPLLDEVKAGTEESELLSIPWLNQPSQLRGSHIFMGDNKEDVFSDLDWMAERVDLNEFDLDSLIEACSPTVESPTSPEDLLTSLDCPMELDSLPLPSFSHPVTSDIPSPTPSLCPDPISTVNQPELYIDGQEVPSSPSFVPEPQEELEIKSEPSSPGSSSEMDPPTYTLDLGSEVDVSEVEEKPVVVPHLPKLILTLSPTRIVLVLAPKNKVEVTAVPKVIHCSPSASPPQIATRPYPEPTAGPSSSKTINVKVRSPRGAHGAERATSSLKAPKDRKVKKMEQNKTAATRYRQKKRAEHDSLATEHAMLERKNVELTEKAESMAREIEYLKELMEEVRLAKIKKGLSPDL